MYPGTVDEAEGENVDEAEGVTTLLTRLVQPEDDIRRTMQEVTVKYTLVIINPIRRRVILVKREELN